MEIRKSSHGAYRTQFHIVWATKYRHRALNPAIFRKEADKAIREAASRIVGVEVVELNVQPEHVHIVAVIPPKYAPAKVVEIIKSRSAKVIRAKIEWLDKLYYDTTSMWSVGYFISTIGIDEELIKRYVRYQNEQDSEQAKLEF